MESFKEYIKKNWLGLLIAILIPQVIGAISALIAGDISEIYKNLVNPPLAPPTWVFPVAWIILYTLIGISSYLVYKSDAPDCEKRAAYILYALQLILNFSWSIVNFKLQAFGAATVILAVLLFTVTLMTATFFRINRLSGYLLIPYSAWLIFALYLCSGVFLLN